MSEWISIKNKLPERYQEVEVCYKGGVYRGYFRGQSTWTISEQPFNCMYENQTVYEITHWMPLPDLPKSTNEDIIIGGAFTIQQDYSKWISIKDRWPKLGQEVLVLDDGYVKIGFAYKYDGFRIWQEMRTCLHLENVTYWMPLPEPPKQEGPFEVKSRWNEELNYYIPELTFNKGLLCKGKVGLSLESMLENVALALNELWADRKPCNDGLNKKEIYDEIMHLMNCPFGIRFRKACNE